MTCSNSGMTWGRMRAVAGVSATQGARARMSKKMAPVIRTVRSTSDNTSKANLPISQGRGRSQPAHEVQIWTPEQDLATRDDSPCESGQLVLTCLKPWRLPDGREGQMPDSHAFPDLAQGFRGQLVSPSDAAYEEARKLYNGMIDKRPRLIARCADVADVITAVNFGREKNMRVAIRGGGHNGPGLGSVDDGLVIDMSAMTGVRVDPVARTARVAAGCTQGDVDHATHPFGHGYLSRRYGLTIDNLIEADLVLADGRFVTASEESDADLFWALRGGGGNFGVVTSFLFRLHPVSMVFAGPIAWDQRHTRTIMQRYREFLPQTTQDLGIFLGLKKVLSSPPFPQHYCGKPICLPRSGYHDL